MTSNYGVSDAVFGGNRVVAPDPRPHLPNNFHTFSLGKQWDGKAIGWELFVNDLSGGLGNVHGGVRESMALESSTLDHRFRGSIMLPSLTTMADIGSQLGGDSRLSSLSIFDTLALAYGNNANSCLWRETSLTDPTLVTRTYSPTSNINALHPVVIGGVANAVRLAVCRTTDPIQILSDLGSTPTVAGTMHSDTDNSFGLIETPLPHSTLGGFVILLYSSNAIRTLSTASAIGDAPTSVLGNVPNGGAALGVKAPLGWPLRAWWQWPKQNKSTELIRNEANSVRLSDLVTTNLEGTDPQRVSIPFPGLYLIAPWQDGFIVSDGGHPNHSVGYWNGQTFEVLPWMTERPRAASGEVTDYRLRGFYIRGDELYLEVSYRLNPSTASTRHVEWFDPHSRRFYQVTSDVQDGAYIQDTARPNGSLPVSAATGFLHTLQDADTVSTTSFWHSFFLDSAVTNPFYLLGNGGLGPTNGALHDFEGSGVATSPDIHLDRLSQYPKVVSEIVYLGGWRDSNADSTAKIEIASHGSSVPFIPTFSNAINGTFNERDRREKNRRKFRKNTDWFIPLKFRLTLTQGTDTGDTPNGLPFIIRGIAFLDGKVRDPLEVLGPDWGNDD